MKRGIFLVANRKSERFCENLVYSIRKSGCHLPIRLIHFGGARINSDIILNEVEMLDYEDFPKEARAFILNLRSVLTDCPLGFLYRFLAWFSDWDEFLYSDNDIVALLNWDKLFDRLEDYDLVHADEEYTTMGKYNYNQPASIERIFGTGSLKTSITAGHFIVRKNSKMIDDINSAVQWFKQNPVIPKKHDQALLHIASLLGKWKVLNLCKPPHNWLSSWSGDYKNPLDLIQILQKKDTNISHLHYSGGVPNGHLAIEEFLYSNYTSKARMQSLFIVGVGYLSEFFELKQQSIRLKRFLKRQFV